MHFATRQTVSFAIHTAAEELGLPKEAVNGDKFDEIEAAILRRFYEFVRDRREQYWLHWNMRNIVFGFEHLEHRYRVLTRQEPPAIPVEVRINLNDILKDRYGDGYAADPKMASLMDLTGKRDPNFMTGKEESIAFKQSEYIRMNGPTISKVEFFRHVVVKAAEGKLKTASRGFGIAVDRLLESRSAKIIALASAVIGIGLAIFQAAF